MFATLISGVGDLNQSLKTWRKDWVKIIHKHTRPHVPFNDNQWYKNKTIRLNGNVKLYDAVY